MNDDAADRRLHTLAEWRKAGRPHVPVLIKEYMPSEFPPAGCALVWLLNGSGRLRTESRDLPEPHVARFFHQSALMLDDSDLLRWRENECPTCPHLLEAAGLAGNEIAVADAAINSWTLEKLSSARPRRWLRDYLPLLSLCKPGFYWVRVSPHFPTDGAGRFFWSEIPPTTATELPEFFGPDCLRFLWGAEKEDPAYLLPTQQQSAFNEHSWRRALETHQSHPGIAFFLSGYGSALLDGHHRATAAAVAGRRFSCVTFESTWYRDGEFHPPLPPTAVPTPKPLRMPPSVWTHTRWCAASGELRGTLREGAPPQPPIPPLEEAVRGVSGMPISFDWLCGVVLRHFFDGRLTDDQWSDLLASESIDSPRSPSRVQKVIRFSRESNRTERWVEYSRWSLTLIQALVGLRVIKDETWQRRWEEAVAMDLEIATVHLGAKNGAMKTPLGEKFLWELLARNESKHPELVAELRQRFLSP